MPLQAPAAPQADAFSALATSSDDGSIVDILVVYTAAARAAAGGTDEAIRARIMLGVTETNTAYANSGVVQRLRLVGAELVDYTEGSDIGLDLERVTGVDEGFMDGVHARRDQLGADLVSLIVESDSGSCGVAWLMQTPSVTFAPQAFSVIAYDCISPNYTFGHELGHNMGAAHAPGDPNLQPAYPYAYGYKDPASLFRTVMAYNCPISSCPRILYFSNPGVSYGGRATGTFERHDNALTLNNTHTVVANFRQTVKPGLGAPQSLTVTTSGTTAMLAWTPPASGAATGYVIEAGSASGLANLALLPTGAATSLVVPGLSAGLYLRESTRQQHRWRRRTVQRGSAADDATGPLRRTGRAARVERGDRTRAASSRCRGARRQRERRWTRTCWAQATPPARWMPRSSRPARMRCRSPSPRRSADTSFAWPARTRAASARRRMR